MAEGIGEVQPSSGGISATYPLNSKRISAAYLRRIAEELGLPATAGIEDLRVMIDHKFCEEGHEPRNVQVTVCAGPPESLSLRDGEGVFLVVILTPKEDLEVEPTATR
jgi:hypothetical protein